MEDTHSPPWRETIRDTECFQFYGLYIVLDEKLAFGVSLNFSESAQTSH